MQKNPNWANPSFMPFKGYGHLLFNDESLLDLDPRDDQQVVEDYFHIHNIKLEKTNVE